MMRNVLCAACLCSGSGLLGFSLAAAAPPARGPAPAPSTQAQAVPPATARPFCIGEEPSFELRLTPTRSLSTPAGEQLEAALTLENHLPNDVRVLYSVELFDDAGNVVVPAKVMPVSKLPKLGKLQGASVRTPEKLSNGFYELRVQAAVKSDESGKTGSIAHLYMQVHDGAVTPLSFEEWAALSRAEEGV